MSACESYVVRIRTLGIAVFLVTGYWFFSAVMYGVALMNQGMSSDEAAATAWSAYLLYINGGLIAGAVLTFLARMIARPFYPFELD